MSLIFTLWYQPQSPHAVGTQSMFHRRKERRRTEMERREVREGLRLYRILYLKLCNMSRAELFKVVVTIHMWLLK